MRSLAVILILAAAGCGLDSGGQPSRQAVNLNNQAYRAYQRGQFEQALTLVNDAIQTDEKFAQAYANKAAILDKLGKQDEAINTLAALIELAPANAEAQISRGVLLEKAGRESESAHHYERALELLAAQAETARIKEKVDIDVKLAVARYLSGDSPAALATLDRVLKVRPDREDATALKVRIESGRREVFLHGLEN